MSVITLTHDVVASLGHKPIKVNGKPLGTITEVTANHFEATVGYLHRTYTVKGYSSAALAIAALSKLMNDGWHWRR